MYVTYACTYSVSRIVAKGCGIGYSKYGPKVKKHYRLQAAEFWTYKSSDTPAGRCWKQDATKQPKSLHNYPSKCSPFETKLGCLKSLLQSSLSVSIDLKLHNPCWGRAFLPFWSAALLEEIGTATTTSLDHPSQGLSRHELLGRWMYHDMSQVALAGGSQIWNM